MIVRTNPAGLAFTVDGITHSSAQRFPGPSTHTHCSSRPLSRRVVAVHVEADGDLHIELADATGNKPGIIICEVPAKPQWCEIRKTIFSWTRTRFPLHIRSTKELTINERPTVTVVGKALWDIGHARKDQSNRRKRMPQYAVWEIHPVMVLQINQ